MGYEPTETREVCVFAVSLESRVWQAVEDLEAQPRDVDSCTELELDKAQVAHLLHTSSGGS